MTAEAADIVLGVATEEARWVKVGVAMQRTADALGLSPRTVQALRYAELRTEAGLSLPALRTRYAAWLDRHALKLEAEAARLRARREAIRRGTGA